MPKAKQKPTYPPTRGMRVTAEDEKIIAALIKKKGGSFPSITREAWRVLAEKEQVSYA
ncbi:MAG: hypothetical protein WBD45_11835 [Terriglobales bacterium]